MHYHVEIHVPSIKGVEQQIATILAPYEDHYEDESNLNPNLWDWYVIGGRWTGAHDGYEPQDDPLNYEKCWLCDGTGFRNDELGRKARAEMPSYTCNGCGHWNDSTKKWEHGPMGPGKMLKHSFVPHYSDVMELDKVADDLSAAYVIAGGIVKEQAVGPDQKGLNVKHELAKLGITNGYLVTVDIHD